MVGLFVAWLAGRLPGAHVILCEIDPARAAMTITFTSPDNPPQACDVVFHASASASGLATAIACAGTAAAIIELS